jgi:PAS domain S-box-containing protein
MSSPSISTHAPLDDTATERIVDGSRHVLWLTLSAVLLLVVIAIVALVVVSRELQAARDSYAEVQRTRETIQQAQRILSRAQDAETGERGYIITGDEGFLDPYERATSSLPAELDQLRRLVTDTQGRVIVEELNVLLRQQMVYLGNIIRLRREQGAQAAADLVQQQIGKQQMDRIREVVASLSNRQESTLTERLEAFNERSERSELVVRIALCAAILLVIISGLLLIRHSRRQLQAELTARSAFGLLRSTLDNITQGIAVFDEERRLVAWNARFLELRGLPGAAVSLHMPLQEILRLGATLEMQTEGGTREISSLPPAVLREAQPFDTELKRGDGAILQVRGRPMPNGHYILTYTDVTQLKKSEEAYRDQATRLSSILDNVVDAIITINESGSIESWSKGAERLFGYSEAEVLRRNVSILMPEPHSSAHDGYIRRYLTTGERRIMGQRRDVEARHKDGTLVPVDLGISEMWLGSRRLFIGVVRDISQRLEVERLKSGFVSTVSHELRTPLTSISGSLGLLAGGVAGAMPPKAARLVEIARLNCERLVRLINDILDLEKAESGKLDFRLESQRLKPIVQHAIDLNRAYAHTFGASIELHGNAADPTVLVDRDRLIQVLTNVLSNAAKFSPRGGTIHVNVAMDADTARITVRDEGPGIGEEFRKRIFQKFAQADSSDSRAKGGTGLGLSIAKTIVERLGGAIGFDTVEGEGTTFHISLPVRHESMPLPQAAPMPARGPSVLVCEDDPDISRILLEVLRGEGFRAEAVADARAGRAVLATAKFDLALVDLHLPDADGLDFIAELRTREATRTLPVIVITARSRSAGDGASVSALQLADWLQKPIDPQRLLQSIRSVLSPARDRRARILHVEDDESLTRLVDELLSDDADVVAAHTLSDARGRLDSTQYDLVILDISLGDGSGLDLLPLLGGEGRASPPVILYSATEPSRELAERVQGALVKSRDSVDHLLATVRSLAGKGG